MALALYRKYRPKKLDEVLGQETNVEILKNAARQNRLAQAYLFYGPRGTGKTTVARIIAKLANCETRHQDKSFHQQGEPCNNCRICQTIDSGSAFDVIEIDAASNRGIDEIRNLKESIRVSPSQFNHKVYIIDEAHMLTKEAVNALLKTLEEPPAHAILILATTEYEKLPPTITSRTQRFLFKRLPKNRIFEKLKMIAAAENLDITDEALELIAAAGEGSFRDAESLLDQIIAFEDKIDLETVERLSGRTGLQKISDLADLLIKKDLKSSLDYVEKINEEGINFIQLTKDLIHYLRKTVALKMNPDLERFFQADFTGEEISRLKNQAGLTDPNLTINLIKSLIRAYGEMRYSPFSFVPLEIALIENLQNNPKPYSAAA